ncbi:MAG TPA: hypothetical protein VJP89_04935 [Pyrinomonadaceae bacterium]|nr:hypothetical protein [Pyrinomonadaceae bacterium]
MDPALLPFLDATNEPEEAAALARLNAEQIEPTIRRGLGYKLRFHQPQGDPNLQRPDFEEIYNDIQLRLLKRLRALKEDPAQNQIANLRGYVSQVTRNTCDEYLRQRNPLRRGLRDKVRRHLLNHTEFALWEDKEDNWLAGLSGWRNTRHEINDPGGDLQARLKMVWQTIDVQRLQLHDLLTTIFAVAQAPLELDRLTELIAGFWRIEDHPVEPLDPYTHIQLDEQMGTDANPATITERRQWLQLLWREICQLPRRQRVALLLNLRNPNGINVITLLPATGIATFEQIAQTLEISVAEFEQLWAQLPLDDLHLAEYLGGTRQQVINLRKTARERLKRMSGLKAR